MIEVNTKYKEYLETLTKNELVKIINDFHTVCDIYLIDKGKSIEKKKKNDIIDYIVDNLEKYIKCFITLLDKSDYAFLNEIIKNHKKVSNDFLVENRLFLNNLLEKKLFFQKDNLEIPSDIFDIIKSAINNKSVLTEIKKNNKLYTIANGIIIAYGVIATDNFDNIIMSVDHEANLKLQYYYKKDYEISKTKVTSNKLTNKKRIQEYLNNEEYREFSITDFKNLGNSTYHHNIKSYKKFIKILKNYYVFKSRDIKYIDNVIVIPYLYNSLNEEELAKNNLIETVERLFEFKGEKLKNKVLTNVLEIRNDFPIWEYRGFTKNEVK